MQTVIQLNQDDLTAIVQKCIATALAETRTPPQLPKPDDADFITEREAVQLLKVSKVTLNKWRRENRIVFYRIGSRIRYKRSDLLSNPVAPSKYGRGAK